LLDGQDEKYRASFRWDRAQDAANRRPVAMAGERHDANHEYGQADFEKEIDHLGSSVSSAIDAW
jgi:hypothetical protein